jgi:hypothetical protein
VLDLRSGFDSLAGDNPADYARGSRIDIAVKGIIDKVASDASLKQLGKKG